MTKIVVGSVGIGALLGYFLLPESFLPISEYIIIIGLSGLLFFVGMDIGMQGTVIKNIKKAGARILMFPVAAIVGTLGGAAFASLILPINLFESLAVGSGMGWYSLAPLLIDQYSASLSAVSFLHNVMRELLGIITIPIVAKYIGHIETISLPGAAAMDVCLPIVEKSTSAEVAIYSFIAGITLSASVPILVPLFLGL